MSQNAFKRNYSIWAVFDLQLIAVDGKSLIIYGSFVGCIIVTP